MPPDVSDQVFFDVANGFLVDNGDGTFSDPVTGDIVDGQGNWLANENATTDNSAGGVNNNSDVSAEVASQVSFDPYGNLSTFEAFDSQGHEVWQSVTADGQVYHVYYDAAGNVVAYTDEFYQPLSNPQIQQGNAIPTRGGSAGSSAGGLQGGGISLGGGGNNDVLKKISDAITLLSQKLAQGQASGASPSTLAAYQAAIANLQSSKSAIGGTSTTTWLIVGGALLAAYALTSQRAA